MTKVSPVLEDRGRGKKGSQKADYLKGNNPLSHVVSLNIKRRHLSVTQIGCITAIVAEKFSEEAKKRQREGKGLDGSGGRGNKKNLSANLHQGLQSEQGKAMKLAVKVTGGKERYGYEAKKIREQDPEAFKEALAGKITLREAKRDIKEAKSTKERAILVKDAPKNARIIEGEKAEMAKIKYRSWEAQGYTRFEYTNHLGEKVKWRKSKAEWLKEIEDIIDEYFYKQNIPLGVRAIKYQLVSKGLMPNSSEHDTKLSDYIKKLRYAGIIDWDAISDESRSAEECSEWNSVQDILNSAMNSYRLPRWSDQDYYLEICCEKLALEPIIKPIGQKYHLTICYMKGWTGTSFMYNISQRMSQKIKEGKKCRILYLGDHDPSGKRMIQDVQDRVSEFLYLDTKDDRFQVVPVALTLEQLAQRRERKNHLVQICTK
ncbi:MAG: hypothetical protein A2166_02115 [Omnitrophica WOR_2 bacterium RBG_13_41_10]|nr:MAG: hypothetical protein A2166_02115 [Omnitrophica WOR_2 bacterium RBG_13_41_10]